MATIRRARPEDAPAMLEIHQASIRELGAERYDEEQVEAWASTDEGADRYPIEDDDHLVVVAERDGAIVGFGGLNLAAAEVGAVYVHPDHAREGVGSRILEHLEAEARERGIGALTLRASLPGVPFYERAGYERVERVTHETGGVEIECVDMRKEL